MRTFKGIGASEHVAVEQIFYLESLDLSVIEKNDCIPEVELKRYDDAKNQAITELEVLYEKTKLTSEETAQVFLAHQMMIEDYYFVQEVNQLLESNKNVEYAVQLTANKFKEMFEAMDDELMRARAADVQDISNRLLRILKGIKEEVLSPKGKFILICEDLLPSDIVKFDQKSIAGFVTKYGSKSSHAAILARTLNLPIVVHLDKLFDEIPHEGILAINGETGEVIVNPDDSIIKEYRSKMEAQEKMDKDLKKYRGQKAISSKGHEVIVAANIGNVSDADLVLENDGDAVGLFRSEFIYLESHDYPSEEKQFQIYKEVVKKLAPRNVIIRTLDIGADKTADYFKLDKEENPALGYRAIRICLKEKELFTTQLRALLRASHYGNLSIMIPMITHLEQVKESKAIFEGLKKEMDLENIPYKTDIQFGIMIETPAAVMISDKLAKLVDFFSIGTNDLTQYTLAVDRMNAKIQDLFDSRHEAVLRMIALTAKNAHDAGIWIGICGESASDLTLLDFYLEHHIDELSVSPSKVLRLKKAIIEK
ncbi:MAG: phosphoenolpyruvate--protein phosphotransferase [Firmicutes bacterium]|nr:phosphoenolpyruvate--protein phosphotransferase [Bacillota bacterium]